MSTTSRSRVAPAEGYAEQLAVAALESAERRDGTPTALAAFARRLAGPRGDAWAVVFEARELLRVLVGRDPSDLATVVAAGWLDSSLPILVAQDVQSAADAELAGAAE